MTVHAGHQKIFSYRELIKPAYQNCNKIFQKPPTVLKAHFVFKKTNFKPQLKTFIFKIKFFQKPFKYDKFNLNLLVSQPFYLHQNFLKFHSIC